jgi:hypothetical protein
MGHVIDLLVVTSTSTSSKFQQLINKVQDLTQTVLASQGQHQVLPPQQVLTCEVAPSILTSQPQVIHFTRRQLYYPEKVDKMTWKVFHLNDFLVPLEIILIDMEFSQ